MTVTSPREHDCGTIGVALLVDHAQSEPHRHRASLVGSSVQSQRLALTSTGTRRPMLARIDDDLEQAKHVGAADHGPLHATPQFDWASLRAQSAREGGRNWRQTPRPSVIAVDPYGWASGLPNLVTRSGLRQRLVRPSTGGRTKRRPTPPFVAERFPTHSSYTLPNAAPGESRPAATL